MSNVVRLKKDTIEDLAEVRKILENNFMFSIDRSLPDSNLLDICVSGYLKFIKECNDGIFNLKESNYE